MKKIASVLMLVVFLLANASCVSPRYNARHTRYRGAGRVGLAGGIVGALLDRRNRWRGGLIGFFAGLLIEATLNEIALKANKEAAASGEPVEYKSDDGRQVYRAEPVNYEPGRKCGMVEGWTWEDGELIDKKEEYVCR